NRNLVIDRTPGHTGFPLRALPDDSVPAKAIQFGPIESSSMVVVEIGAFSEFSVDNPSQSPIAEVQAFDSGDASLFDPPRVLSPNNPRVRLEGTDIKRVTVTAEQGDFLIEDIYVRTPIMALATSASDPTIEIGTFSEVDGLVTVRGLDLGKIFLTTVCGGEFIIPELS